MKTWSITIILSLILVSGVAFTQTMVKALHPPLEDQTFIGVTAGVAKVASTSITVAKKIPVKVKVLDKLMIPSIGVSADIEKVGVNLKGNIATPSTFHTTGLYVGGPKPGEAGIAFIDGHLNDGLGLPAVFANLSKLKIGDSIYIKQVSGNQLQFIVDEVYVLDYSAHLEDIINKSDSSARLALITCSGTWLPEQRLYDKRLVVLAKLKQN